MVVLIIVDVMLVDAPVNLDVLLDASDAVHSASSIIFFRLMSTLVEVLLHSFLHLHSLLPVL